MSDTDRRFCGGCQSFKPIEGGVLKETKHTPRWICKTCAARMSNSAYSKKRKQNALPVL